MPELPEVETIRKDLNEKIIDKKIIKVWSEQGKVVRSDRKFFTRELFGRSFDKIERVGKLLMFKIKESNKWMLAHLKMTGQLIYVADKNIIAGGHSFRENDFDLPSKYTRVVFTFQDGSRLFFNDMRKFGYVQIVSEEERQKIIQEKFGIEPGQSSFKLEKFKDVFRGRKTNVKAILLNQKLIAGIGNIYADESCYAARIKPMRLANSLTEEELKVLFVEVKRIIKKAILKRGTTFNNYRDTEGMTGNFSIFLKVYGRGGENCMKCGGVLEKGKVAGRGTVWCNKCQI